VKVDEGAAQAPGADRGDRLVGPVGVLVDQGLDGLGWGLGMSVVVDSEKSLTIDRDGDFWWAGCFGTYWAVSPEADLVGVVFSQNEPGPYSDIPFAPAAAVSLALAGL
jgi:CubicO group peptidase (beta-lactamase class C family)